MAKSPDIHVKKSPIDLLLPYQRKLADDPARFKFALQARQTGKDFTSGAEGIRDCFLHEKEKKKIDWLIAAPSERQSLESLVKWKDWVEAFKLEIADSFEERTTKSGESLLKSSTIVFPNGSRVIAVPGHPDTVRGFCANVLLTEFAFFENPDATWRAIYPSISNPLRGLKKIRLVTTPNGIGNKAHDLWAKNYQQPNATWSCHHVDIYEAKAQGLPVDIDELRAGLDDPEGWAQEYELNFLDQATVLLPYDLIIPCENPLAGATIDPAFWNTASGGSPIFLGVDFGRKHDLTVCWSLELIGGAFRMTKEVLELRNVSTPDQLTILRDRCRRAHRVCFDYTGPGTGLGDLLVREFQEYNEDKHLFGKIELCTFTNKLKVDIFPKLRMAFEQKTIGIPVNRAIREDLHSVNRVALAGGAVTYRAPHNADGHADRCTALALAIRAASFNQSASPIYIFENTRRSQVIAAHGERSVAG